MRPGGHDSTALGDQAHRSHGVGQRFSGALGDPAYGRFGQQIGKSLHRGPGREDAFYRAGPQCGLDEVGAFCQKKTGPPTGGGPVQFDRVDHCL
ncbi:Uncharacterised protein [Mycobacteroides abscessus subsp. massiliense]|nr:Uncharacterised protein [Mycobacteroides abscessus subsp. massiliense]